MVAVEGEEEEEEVLRRFLYQVGRGRREKDWLVPGCITRQREGGREGGREEEEEGGGNLSEKKSARRTKGLLSKFALGKDCNTSFSPSG